MFCQKKVTIERKLKVLVPFLSDQKIGGQIDPLSRLYFSKLFDQNFEIAILFSIVERPNNYAFRDNITPHSPWERSLYCKICP